jgi:hypothetical protein
VMEGHGAYIKVTLSSTLRVMARIKWLELKWWIYIPMDPSNVT